MPVAALGIGRRLEGNGENRSRECDVTVIGGRLAVIVVNYGSEELLQRNLVAVERAARAVHDDLMVVVVDNWAGEDSRRDAASLARTHGWHLVAPSENLGFGGGVNRGMEYALANGASDALVINPDAHIDQESLDLLAATTAADRSALAAPVTIDSQGRVWFAGVDLILEDGTMRSHRRRTPDDPRPGQAWLSGACLWITDEVWRISGGFDDDYFLYWEDVDFSRRVISGGGSLVLVEGATAVHDEGGTQGGTAASRAKSETYYYYNIRNRMLYAVRHLDEAAVRRWRRTIPRTAREVILRGGRRQLLQSAAPIRAYLRGVREARRIARSHDTHRKDPSWS